LEIIISEDERKQWIEVLEIARQKGITQEDIKDFIKKRAAENSSKANNRIS
jgi:hypothetical protein